MPTPAHEPTAATPSASSFEVVTRAGNASNAGSMGSAGSEGHSIADPSQRPERRACRRRLDDAALAAVRDASRLLIVAFDTAVLVLAVLLGRMAWANGDPSPAVWAVSALVTAAVGSAIVALRSRASHGKPPGRDWRHAQTASSRGALALTAVLALAPWSLPPDASAEARYAVAFMLAGYAWAVAGALAPTAWLPASGTVLPLSSAIENAARGHTPTVASAFEFACLGAAALAAVLAWGQHGLWRRAALRRLQDEDRIRELGHARDAAVKADQEKSRFLAIASHDLRQPVHAIGLFAATLEKRLEGTAEEPLVRNLSGAIDGLDRSFNVMLDISRLDAGAIEPRLRHFPLRDLFRRLHMHFAGQAEQKSLGLRFSPGGKSISSDPQLLERVLGNLVQNAIKYTERGGIVVVARSTPTHVNVEIWDTGVGIRAADLRKIFDEFYQVGHRERMRAQGLGMGLAIVKRLVRLLGHELTVSSRPGKGTMFRLRIALGGLPEIQDVTAAADTLPMPILSPRTVLVLDDEEPIREGLRMLLQEWGFEAFSAGSIDEALEVVAALEAPPDLILSDLHLGDGIDGIGAIEAIRRRCGVEVAAMLITGDTSHAEIRRATESGHALLFKPVQPRKLYDALRGLGS